MFYVVICIVYPGSVASERYIDQILEPMLTNVEERKNNASTRKSNNSRIRPLFKDSNDWIFEQDHASAHTAYATQEFLEVWTPNQL